MRKLTYRNDQREAQERKKALAERFLKRKNYSTDSAKVASEPASISNEIAASKTPRNPAASMGLANIELYDRNDPRISLKPEPWLKRISNLILEVSSVGGAHIALMWPARVESFWLAHSIAALERLAIRDLLGLRTVVYPVKPTSFNKLNHFLLDRPRICEMTKALWVGDVDSMKLDALRHDDHKAKFLSALLTIEAHESDTPFPTAAELLPSFIYNPETGEWGDYRHRLLARCITRLRLGHRRDIRSDAFEFVGAPHSAPDALFGIPYGSKKEVWKKALGSSAFEKGRKPELILVDASDEMRDVDRRLVKRIPEFITIAREVLRDDVGILVLTDHPAAFFMLKSALSEDLKITVKSHIIVNEFSGTGLSSVPHPEGYIPVERSLRHYGFEIIDKEASGTANKLLGLSRQLASNVEASQACADAAYYVLQLCYLPGGYQDLGWWLEADGRSAFTVAKLAWATYEARMRRLLKTGAMGAHAHDAELALERAAKLVSNSWFDATPVALKLAKELSSVAARAGKRALVVLLKGPYIDIARQFLRRHFSRSTPFENFESRIVFITHREIRNYLSTIAEYDRVLLVGMNEQLLRLLVTSEEIPAGTTVLLGYAQAITYKNALISLKSIGELKSFKGRVSGMADELEKRLTQIPNPIPIDRLPTRGLSFNFESTNNTPENAPQELWRLDLEGAGRLLVAKRVFQYRPEEDPPFVWTAVTEIQPGDSVFAMSDDLRDLVEATLSEVGFTAFKKGHTFVGMLELYHAEVRRRSKELFPENTKRACARRILDRMGVINPTTKDCSLSRVLHWLDLDDDAIHERPQAARDRIHFEAFVRALEIPEALYKDFWVLAINTTRNESRLAGREMADFYTNVIFHPESLQVYHKVAPEVLARLTRAATDSVYRVTAKTPPLASHPQT
jgi:hypothetical protein